MTTRLDNPAKYDAAQPGDEVLVEGQVIHVGPPTLDLTEPAAGRIGRQVTVFVETDEDPSVGTTETFGDLLVETGSAEHVAGSGGPTLNRPDPNALASQRPDVNLLDT